MMIKLQEVVCALLQFGSARNDRCSTMLKMRKVNLARSAGAVMLGMAMFNKDVADYFLPRAGMPLETVCE